MYTVNDVIYIQSQVVSKVTLGRIGAILEYPATYLHMPKMLCRTRHIKTKDLFLINDMQIRGRVFYNLAEE